ncbi:hypothetical protein OG439_40700 [Amycolatopsis sp. NBC_01307]|uniref:hypothetical protein n=1 Tax=Amycolatopsis sp. NBC_01307 TaxID=2903561 RepID=UPI002E125F05|nr:hypothetical protein OG439_40700 [Amycolatopsis sp. NBC_01307]
MVQQPPPTTIVVSPTSPDVVVNLPSSPSTIQTIVTLVLPVVAAILAALATHFFAQQRAKADTIEARRRDELGHAATMLAAAIPWVRSAEYYIRYSGLAIPDKELSELLDRTAEKLNAADKDFLFARTAANLIVRDPVVKDYIKQVKDSYDSFPERFEKARNKLAIEESVAECRRFRELTDAMNDAVVVAYTSLPNDVVNVKAE